MIFSNNLWQDISSQAKQRVLDNIPSEWKLSEEQLPGENVLDVTDFPKKCGVMTLQELEITDSYATEIVERIARGEWTSEEVTRAFCKRAAIAHQLTNCLTVIMFDDAIKRARHLDLEFQKTGQVTGPLHGLPVSLKDNFNIPGYPSSVGFCAWALEPVQQESTIVGVLRDLGAVAYVKTNVPVAMMMPETVNNCHGRTVNPINRATTPGGSSGGEAALIACHGSPLGVGTDIGGSLRIPAACTGIFTLRPSYGRFPHFDARSGLAGQEAVASVHGPMARSVADLRLFCENVIASRPFRRDPKCVDLPWRGAQIKSKPKIAVLWDNGLVHPTPPVARALKETADKLRLKGYEIIDWPADDHKEANDLLLKFFIADGGKSIRGLLESTGEPWFRDMELYEKSQEIGVFELWQLQKARTALAKRYLDRIEACEGLDAILGPTTPFVSPKHTQFRTVGYTGVYNIVDYSSVSFPTGIFADKAKDAAFEHEAFSEVDALIVKDYEPDLVHGMPVSLQLTGKRLEEEKILALTEKVLEDLRH